MTRKIPVLFIAYLGLASCFTSDAQASMTLTIGDANYLGTINDGVPSSEAEEASYINNLITLAPGAGPVLIGTETYDRVSSTLLAPFKTAVSTGAIKDENGPFTGTYQYVLGKYDATKAGSLVWYFADGIEVSTLTFPGTFNGQDLSHVSAFNAKDPQVPEPSTFLIWSLLGVGGLGLAYRRRKAA